MRSLRFWRHKYHKKVQLCTSVINQRVEGVEGKSVIDQVPQKCGTDHVMTNPSTLSHNTCLRG